MLNEPETSLHPELLPALADLVRRASRDSQLIVVTHSDTLVRELRGGGRGPDPDGGVTTIELAKDLGRTVAVGGGTLDEPVWHWPSR